MLKMVDSMKKLIHTKNGEEHTVDHVNDLIPVCYECHKYIHSRGTKKKPYSISELRDLIDFLAAEHLAELEAPQDNATVDL